METLDCTRSPSKYKYPFSTRSSESFRTSRNTSRLKRKYMIRLKRKKITKNTIFEPVCSLCCATASTYRPVAAAVLYLVI